MFHMRQARPSLARGQTWATFLRNQAKDIWACDFVQFTAVCFRPLFALVITELGSRRIVHVGVTRAPTDGCPRSNCGRPRPSALRRSTSSATMMRNTALASTQSRREPGSPRSERQFARRVRTPSVSD